MDVETAKMAGDTQLREMVKDEALQIQDIPSQIQNEVKILLTRLDKLYPDKPEQDNRRVPEREVTLLAEET